MILSLECRSRSLFDGLEISQELNSMLSFPFSQSCSKITSYIYTK